MARYVVQVVVPDGHTLSLLIALSPDQLCSALRDKVKSRLSAHGVVPPASDDEMVLRFGAANGPLIDPEDLLTDVLADNDVVFVTFGSPLHGKVGPATQSTQQALDTPSTHVTNGKTIRVRVITPRLARSIKDIRKIPLLPENSITLESTLMDLEARVCRHLGLTVDEAQARAELQCFRCNCSLARKIESDGILNGHTYESGDALRTLVVVYGNNKVACLPVVEPTKQSLNHALESLLHAETVNKTLFMIGGIQNAQTQNTGSACYLKLPVVALCSPDRHKERGPSRTHSSDPQRTVLDLHTSEMPIHITVYNAQKTLAEVGLEDCMVNGVLNIYAVKRFTREGNYGLETLPSGKENIYCRGLAWNLPSGQSERGLANFLCSLRQFASLSHASKMEPAGQDAVLHIVMLLTRFPPAVRAIHILMRGETPRASERAAIVQCFNEILTMVVPLRVVQNDMTRLLEGSRLLFGLILEKAKHLKVSAHKETRLPYMDTFGVHELRNFATMEPVADPIQTGSGLADLEFFHAFKEDGPLLWSNGDPPCKLTYSHDKKLQRACLLSGGVKPRTLGVDIDAINSTMRYVDRGDIGNVISGAEYSNLQYLANLCGRNGLGVLHPSALPSADPPVLTLDRAGLLALYVGRQACGTAGRDINMFRPTSSVVEEAVDVSIITQLLVPILNRRNIDGSAIFESFGDQARQIREPDEVVVLCVDASASMDDRCGFIDVEENEDDFEEEDAGSESGEAGDDSATEPERENLEFERPALDELKEFLATHESFDDILAITQTGTDDFHRHRNAEKALELLRKLNEQQITEKTKALEQARSGRTTYHYRQQRVALESSIATLRNRNIRLKQYQDTLGAFLIYRAENRAFDEPLTWVVGQDVPPLPQQSSWAISDSPKFDIPNDFICPISADLMDDPVVTADGFTYERRNIERWLQTHITSPCTNCALSSSDVRPNYPLKSEIADWIAGVSINTSYASSGSSDVKVCFKWPLGTCTTPVPSNITVTDLYKKAFQLTKGLYNSFVLHHRNAVLDPIPAREMPSIDIADPIVLTPITKAGNATAPNANGEWVLIKVYEKYESPEFSYWEPRTTGKTLASIIFRYYRDAFQKDAWKYIGEPLTPWMDMVHNGDGHYRGYPRNHWEQLSRYFDPMHAKGKLAVEPVYSQENEMTDMEPLIDGQPLVLKVKMNGPPARSNHNHLTRLGVLKQMFDGYVNRLLAYGYQTHLGLVTFRSTPSVTTDITHAIENFRHQLNNIGASGDTALWDAIALSRDLLVQYATKYPKAKLRIICLSDGTDTKSSRQAYEIASGLIQDRIKVDSFCLGDVDNLDLQTISYVTGGYKFQPDEMEHAMAICEMEPVLSGLERPATILPYPAHSFGQSAVLQFTRAKSHVELDVVTRDEFPLRKQHPLLSESFVELGSFTRASSITMRSDSNLRLARIHSEIRNSGANVHPHYDIYICESNFAMWKVVMQGPPESTYANGTFVLYLQMGDDYPAFPPKGRFLTPIYHPNINRHGRICHSIFDRNWTADTTNKNVIDTVYSLLLVPEFSDPINTVVTLNFHWDEVQFKEEAQREIQKHASNSREYWKREITGE